MRIVLSKSRGVRLDLLLFFSAIFLLGTSSIVFGAGAVIDFENFSTTPIYINSVHNGPATSLITGPSGTYYFELLEAEPTTTSIDATLDNGTQLDQGGWITAGAIATNTGTPGLISGNIDIVGYGPGAFVGDDTPGQQVSLALVGWSANIGGNYSEAKTWWNVGNPTSGPSGYFAISNVAQDIVLGGGPDPIPELFGPDPPNAIQGFTMNYYSVPEPSPVLVLGFSALPVLLLRRRRRAR